MFKNDIKNDFFLIVTCEYAYFAWVTQACQGSKWNFIPTIFDASD